MGSGIELRRLDEALLRELLRAAVADAEPPEVMPPVPGPPGWSTARRAAFTAFHRSRSLAAEPVERTYPVVLAGRVVGAARLCPPPETGRPVEAGLWLGRSVRGAGVGTAVLGLLREAAAADGAGRLRARTTADNTAALRVLSSMGAELRHDGSEVGAWLETGAG
ncbi:GNAT family N-acetyltransferase [Streptomyces sp. TRM 70351]|uniref:GNAT family N-acetyltransferase n=1 Tax=Streptomyces sp. TRM 70351 TaxID=3116552 RepID=UPI002E7B3BF2|nr:GNAT family N-acetyltransferase [Streptomyces sp. TRM 70351]MEE1930758.1 GNAT family N-acetyltransferase [Streptomyces sp. TRM 70351]